MTALLTTGDFLRAVLPSQGVYFAARLIPARNRGFIPEPCQTIQELSHAVQSYDLSHADAYFAVQSYQQSTHRRRENVKAIRAVWVDIDVGKPGAYSDRNTALTALTNTFCTDASLPTPSVIAISGYGIHAYWTFTRDLTLDEWQPLASGLRALAYHHNLLADLSVTVDAARVLRPAGTHNYKRTSKNSDIKPAPVRAVLTGPDLDPDEFLHLLETRCQDRELSITYQTPRRVEPTGDLADLVAGANEYPLADAEKIAEQCAVFREMRDTRGANQDQPLWLHSLCVLSKTKQADDVTHSWCDGHEDYDPSAVDSALERIEAMGYKPARCDTFRTMSSLCTGCSLKVNSPIALGMYEEKPKHRASIEHEDGTRDEVGDLPEFLKSRFAWTFEEGLRVKVDKKLKDGEEKKEGDGYWAVISRQCPVPEFLWYDDAAVEWNVRMRAFVKKNDWSVADLKLASVGQGGTSLSRDLAGKLRVLSVGSPQPMESFVKTWIDDLQRHTDTQRVSNNMGWQSDGSFLLGNTLYRPNGEIRQAAIGRAIANVTTAHTVPANANLDRFRELLTTLYDRPGFESVQFALMASLGSVILPLVWNGPVGIPVCMWSEKSGLGKTTLAKIAISLWGAPFAGGQSAKGAGKGSTELAFSTMAGQRRNLPVLLDEATDWPPARLSEFLYGYSDGTPKQQAKAEGGLRDNAHLSWSNIIFLTSNTSVVSKLSSELKNTGPQIARIFEYALPLHVKPDVADQPLVDEIYKHYGVAGAHFIQHVVQNQDLVAKATRTLVQRLHQACNVKSDARYWTHAVACAIVAGKIAKALNIMEFDVKAVHFWAMGQIVAMAGKAVEAHEDYEDCLSDMIRDLYPGLIITLDEGWGSGLRATFPPGIVVPRGPIHGRVITENKEIRIAHGSVKRWCSSHGVDINSLLDDLDRRGILKSRKVSCTLGRGTHIPTGSASCYIFEGDTVFDTVKDVSDNVIRGRFATNTPIDNSD